MSFTVGHVSPEDFEQVSAVIFEAYRGENAYINAWYPENLTKDGQAKGTQRLRNLAGATDLARFEKVTDGATGKIVGVAIWLVYEHEKPVMQQQSSERVFESEDAEFAAALSSSLNAVQAPFWQDNDVPLISEYTITTAFELTEAYDIYRSSCYDCATRIPISRRRYLVDEVRSSND
jgi:hypothetical protein